MNAFQLQLIRAHGYEFVKTERRGKYYVAIAHKDGFRDVEAGHPDMRKAERRLVHVIIDA